MTSIPNRSEISLTIIIVSFRCQNLLRNCLSSLALDHVTNYAHVVVLDNDSGDGTDQMVSGEFPWVEFRQTGANLGFARANNLALADLSTEFCLLLNPDTVVPPLALQRSLEELRRHEDVGILGCKLKKLDGSLDHACKRSFPSLIDSILYFTRLDRLAFRLGRRTGYAAHHLGDDEAGEVDAVNGAFMLVRSTAIAKVGVLDERFWMYGEDLDWCFRFWKQGWKVYYWPKVEVVHVKGGSEGASRSWRSNRAFHEAMWRFYEKHYAQHHSVVSNRLVKLGIYAKLVLSGAPADAKRRWSLSTTTPSLVVRPLEILFCSARKDVAEILEKIGQERVVLTQRTGRSDRRPPGIGALLLGLHRKRPDLVVFDSSVSKAVLSVVRAAGWRTFVIGERDADHITVAELAKVAGRPGAGLTDGPPVSVIATVFNEITAVDDLVTEVLGQLKVGDEFVVSDGGSSDGTLERLREWEATRPELRIVHAPGTGISAGRNMAIQSSQMPVIACADAGCHPGDGWLDSLRMPFAEGYPRLGLVAGVPRVGGTRPLDIAQAAACYPDPFDARHPSLLAKTYGKVFGTSFHPDIPFARFLAFTREAWETAGGFPEGLGWVEDGVFGRAVAKSFDCLLVTDGDVVWSQRSNLWSTFKMYRNYGIGASQSGDRLFLVRDGTRAIAYLVGIASLRRGGTRVRQVMLAGGLAYLSLPLARALRRNGGASGIALLPLALVTKDAGKVCGELCAMFKFERRR